MVLHDVDGRHDQEKNLLGGLDALLFVPKFYQVMGPSVLL